MEALQILCSEKIDVIISDILMPEMDGYRLCYEVRRNERLQDLPIHFLYRYVHLAWATRSWPASWGLTGSSGNPLRSKAIIADQCKEAIATSGGATPLG